MRVRPAPPSRLSPLPVPVRGEGGRRRRRRGQHARAHHSKDPKEGMEYCRLGEGPSIEGIHLVMVRGPWRPQADTALKATKNRFKVK